MLYFEFLNSLFLGCSRRAHAHLTWVLIVVAMVSFSGVVLAQKGPKGPTTVIVEPVREDTFRDQAEAIGTLRANESVELTVNVTETITAIHFEDGQQVNAQDILVEMTSAEESALLEEAQSNLHEAKRQLDRIKKLVKAGTASESLLDQRQRDYSGALARFIATQSRLKDRIVTAPFSGIVGLRIVSLGALVRPGDLITTLTDSSRMKLDFDVPAVFLPMLKRGLAVSATTRAYREHEFQGTVSSIDNQIDPVTRSITVRAILPNDKQLLKQGMLMHIELSMNERQALVVSESSIVPDGQDNFVLVANKKDSGFVAERRKVEIASRRLGEVEITEGLSLGEQVIIHGGFKVKPGAPIKIQSDSESANLLGKTGI